MATLPLLKDYILVGLDFQVSVLAIIALFISCPKCLLTVSFKMLFLLGRERNNEGGKNTGSQLKKCHFESKKHSKCEVPALLSSLMNEVYSCISK